MSNNFDEFKKQVIDENEKNYGEEIREKYGDDAMEASEKIINGLTEEKWNESERLRMLYESELKSAVEEGLPVDDERVVNMCRHHGEWMTIFWGEENYSKAAHAALADVYASDSRFIEYYEAIVKGGADYICKAIKNYTVLNSIED